MSARSAVLEIIGVLRNIPSGTILPSHIGEASPAQASDLPAIAVSLDGATESPTGIGGIVGWSLVGDKWIQMTSTRTKGTLTLDIWTATATSIAALSAAVFQVVSSASPPMQQSGFLAFGTNTIQTVESSTLADATDAARMSVLFSIVHEDTVSAATGPGGIIQQIEVDVDGQFNEKMILKA